MLAPTLPQLFTQQFVTQTERGIDQLQPLLPSTQTPNVIRWRQIPVLHHRRGGQSQCQRQMPTQAIIRYALETNDPWLADLVRRADAGETVVDSAGFLKISDTEEEKIAALAEMICRAGDEAGTKSAALLVLMSTLENATHPKALANLAKHLAFTRCGELNLNGMVEAQIAVLESELLADNTLVS